MYAVITPGPRFNTSTLAEAKRRAHAGLDRLAAKRGYSLRERTERRGGKTYHYMHVLNSKGSIITGCTIVKVR